jgi:hypothetical protein
VTVPLYSSDLYLDDLVSLLCYVLAYFEALDSDLTTKYKSTQGDYIRRLLN